MAEYFQVIKQVGKKPPKGKKISDLNETFVLRRKTPLAK